MVDEGEISVPADKIKTSAGVVSGLKKDLDTPINDLNKIDVKPGDFTEATNLKNTVDTRKGEAVKLAKAVQKELDSISNKMIKNANNANETENENMWEAKGAGPSNDE